MPVQVAQRWLAVAQLASEQNGQITRDQLTDRGFDRGAIEAAKASGRLFAVHRGVYAVGYVPNQREARWAAAVLACGESALLGFRSGATLWRIRDGEGPKPDVLVPTRAGLSRPRIRIHRTDIAPPDVACRFGIPVTSTSRTIVDLASCLTVEDLQRALREMQYLRLFDLAGVQEVLSRRPSRKLQPLIDDIVFLQTGIEADFFSLCDRFRIERPETQKKVHGVRPDFLWRAQQVIVETDGWWAHSTFDAFQRDRAATNMLQLRGYLVLRFTFADVTKRPAHVARQVRAALGRVVQP